MGKKLNDLRKRVKRLEREVQALAKTLKVPPAKPKGSKPQHTKTPAKTVTAKRTTVQAATKKKAAKSGSATAKKSSVKSPTDAATPATPAVNPM